MHQTYENIEIICVDGGSSDSTPDILKSLQSIDDRIIIVNDKNTSYGHKVNVGVEKPEDNMYVFWNQMIQ